ncbi:hypothetical protein LSH36_547g04005 [Paralvinella palmiformis]|uniref:LicD/FKTN/FKRP nucleotidyltransferase domain-containing protein n=1 Tax=Paralvinella palmiformis TaxID=53620 RepID=A0AAD9J7I6_9ANNE|nr:hypothetical protein LSH36_547g04005 [Paralvinella palmiformis]
MGLWQRVTFIKSSKSLIFTTVFFLFLYVIVMFVPKASILGSNTTPGLQNVTKLYGPVYIEQMINSCKCYSSKDQKLLPKMLKTGPSSRIWDGLHIDQLKSLRGDLKGGNRKRRTGMTKVGTAYHPAINATYRRMMKDLIVAFNDVAKEQNLIYFLYGGTLIGSYRHHGMIPWDDDVDVAVYDKQKSILKAAFSSLPKTFKGVVAQYRWKLTFRHLPPTRKGKSWSYPFLDISFFGVSSDVVYDTDRGWNNRGFRFKTGDVFPLVERPFWDLWLPAPRRTGVVLNTTYNIETCVSLSYSHREEKFLDRSFVLPCDKIKDYYPVVERRTRTGSLGGSGSGSHNWGHVRGVEYVEGCWEGFPELRSLYSAERGLSS